MQLPFISPCIKLLISVESISNLCIPAARQMIQALGFTYNSTVLFANLCHRTLYLLNLLNPNWLLLQTKPFKMKFVGAIYIIIIWMQLYGH